MNEEQMKRLMRHAIIVYKPVEQAALLAGLRALASPERAVEILQEFRREFDELGREAVEEMTAEVEGVKF